jgi:peptide deformylase
VDVRAWDRHGKPWQESFQDFAAAVVQHETDHLDGLFFFTRMPDPNRIAFEEEFSRYVRDAEDHDCEGDCDCGH